MLTVGSDRCSFAAASLKTSAGTTTASNGVPALMRLMMFGVGSKWMESVCPLAFSNCGPSSLNKGASEPPAMSLSSEALLAVMVAIINPSAIAILFIRIPLIRDGDLGSESGLAHLAPRERRSFLEPRARRGRAPQGLAARIVQRPAQRLM